MGASDVATYLTLIDKGGVIAVLLLVLTALSAVSGWLLKALLAHKDRQILFQQAQLDRQQDLFDKALEMLREGAYRRGAVRS